MVGSSRRNLLKLIGSLSGGLVLRSLATGIPLAILENPRKALAAMQNDANTAINPQFLLFASSGQGDPFNCHVPGTYAYPAIYHPPSPLFAPTTFTLGSQQVTMAQTFSQLTSDTLNRTCFFHHSTYSGIHTDEGKVLSLMGSTSTGDTLVSMISDKLQLVLNTIQASPMVLSSGYESVNYHGTPISSMSPSNLSQIYGQPALGPNTLLALRDNTLNQLNALLKNGGTPSQRNYVDGFVLSQTQARQIPTDLLSLFSTITNSSVQSQVAAAIGLFKMRLTPTVVIHIPFGGDNHHDTGLATEIGDYDGNAPLSGIAVAMGGKSGVAALADMQAQLVAAGMADNVTFGMLNVFGRTMGPQWQNGRTHNQNHHVALMIGKNVAPSVIGGLQPFTSTNNGARALGIDPMTGAGLTSGGIPYDETLAAFGRTMVRAVGLSEADAGTIIKGGTTVQAALTV